MEKITIRTNILSASKQSMRTWFPELILADNLQQVKLEAEKRSQGKELNLWAAHESVTSNERLPKKLLEGCNLFFIGPEGGFSANELSWFKHERIPQILLGNQLVDGNVLRAETALVTILAKYY